MSSLSASTMQAQAHASGISRQLGDYEAKHGVSGRGASTEYKKIPDILDQLEAALRTAISMDEAQAGGFWEEAKYFIKQGWDYWGKKAEFDAAVKDLKDGAWAAMNSIRSQVEGEAVPRLGKPEELFEVAAKWAEIAATARALAVDGVPPLREVQGWSGTAYGEYQTMTGVQVEAVKEYAPLPEALYMAYDDASALNTAVLTAVHQALSGALASSAQCYAAPADTYYVNTAAVGSALKHCDANLPGILTMSEDAAGEMGSNLGQVSQAPVVINGGWPSGTSQAGQQAADTAADGRAPDPGAAPPPTRGTGSDQGIER